VNDVITAIGLGVVTYLGTGVDNAFALAAQLSLTNPARYRRVRYAFVAGMATLVIFAGAIGGALSIFSVRWIGVLALAPLGLAIASWRGGSHALEAQRRGAVATFSLTLALGGDNIAVWVPLFRSQGVLRGVTIGVTIVLISMGVARGAQALVERPRIIAWGERWALRLTPFLYLALSLLIMWQCQWFTFLD
jgi:cadmium resistance protein CadD (predicted permease)